MLVLNELLQRTRIPAYIWFSKVEYSQLRAIFTLLIEKSNVEGLVKDYSNLLIRVAKLINKEVIGVEAFKHWQKLKVYKMSLVKYLGKKKIELLWREIESFIEIMLKIFLHWLINKTQLEKCLGFENGKSFAMVIMTGNSIKASRLYSKKLRFSGTFKVIKKDWEGRPSLVYITYSGIEYDWLGGCEDKTVQYIICIVYIN